MSNLLKWIDDRRAELLPLVGQDSARARQIVEELVRLLSEAGYPEAGKISIYQHGKNPQRALGLLNEWRERVSKDKPPCYVTLSQMANMVNRTKGALEKRKAELPAPSVKGSSGRPDEWEWSIVMPILSRIFDKPNLPEIFPDDWHR